MKARDQEMREIDELYRAWGEAFRKGDVAAILELLTPDYVLWAGGAAPMTRESLAPRLEMALAAYEVTPTFEREDCLVSGNLAFETGWDIQEARSRTGGEPRSQRQRVFLVLQRGDDGRWRFARGISQPGPAA